MNATPPCIGRFRLSPGRFRLISEESDLILMTGSTVGGHLGPRFALRHGEHWVRRRFVLLALASAALPSLRQG